MARGLGARIANAAEVDAARTTLAVSRRLGDLATPLHRHLAEAA